MSGEFLLGLAAPFAVAVGGLAVWAGYAGATYAWAKLHTSLIARVDLRRNPVVYRLAEFDDAEADEAPQYSVAAQRFVDALIRSPRMYSLAGLGWRVVLVRDYREVTE